MIIDKKKKVPQIEEVKKESDDKEEGVIEKYKSNGMIGAYKAIRSILESIKKDPNDPKSPPLFKTVKIDNGQLGRIKNNKINKEGAILFPAVFIHYIEPYYSHKTAGISEGRGTMKLRYVLNRLNIGDDEAELEGMEIFQRIIEAIEEQKSKFPELVSMFQLQYWDQPLSFEDGLQQYWISYEIRFTDYTAYTYKNYKSVHVVCPPFTQYSDQNEEANPDNKPNIYDPDMDNSAGIESINED